MEVTTVKEFLEKSDDRRFDRHNFLSHVAEESKRLDEKFHFFRHLGSFEELSFASPLKGLPVSVKDNICVRGMPSSAGSKILFNYIPPFDATSVKNIRRDGGNILGKTNQDEFGFGTFSTNSGFDIPLNPHDTGRTCGGSSGGAAGITAATTFPHIALAESTGGSISCPASFCGVVGLTPTYGLVSRYGLIDYANSLDKIGVIAKNVQDASLLLTTIAGHDPRDMTSIDSRKMSYAKHAVEDDNLRGRKIAVPREYFKNIDKDVENLIWKAIEKMEEMGATYREVNLPTTKYALAAYYIIATSEASTNLARYCGIRYGLHKEMEGNFNEYFSLVRSEGFGDEAKRRIMLGTFARMSGYRDQYYTKALRVRTMIINDFKKIFKRFDAIAAPTMPVIAPKFKEIEKLPPVKVYQMDVLTVAPNLAGIPHISIPCGTSKNMPVGLHLMADHLHETKLIEIASTFEHATRKREEKK